MISTFLATHSGLVPVALLLVALGCVGAGYLFLRASRHRALWWLALLSVLPVVALTFVPTAGRAFEVCAVQFALPSLGAVEAVANVALFFPPVFFAALVTRRPLLVLAVGVGASAAIEAVQAAVPAIGRACDTNDWLMNTSGAVVAALLASGTIVLVNRADVTRGRST